MGSLPILRSITVTVINIIGDWRSRINKLSVNEPREILRQIIDEPYPNTSQARISSFSMSSHIHGWV